MRIPALPICRSVALGWCQTLDRSTLDDSVVFAVGGELRGRCVWLVVPWREALDLLKAVRRSIDDPACLPAQMTVDNHGRTRDAVMKVPAESPWTKTRREMARDVASVSQTARSKLAEYWSTGDLDRASACERISAEIERVIIQLTDPLTMPPRSESETEWQAVTIPSLVGAQWGVAIDQTTGEDVRVLVFTSDVCEPVAVPPHLMSQLIDELDLALAQGDSDE